MLANSVGYSEQGNLDKQKKDFYSFAMTRSWGYATWKIDHMEEGFLRLEESSSLVAFAFKYWLLTKDGNMERNPSFERQIRATISEGKLPMVFIEDPLARQCPNGTIPKSAGRIISDEEYATLTKEFQVFFDAGQKPEIQAAEQDGGGQPATRPESK